MIVCQRERNRTPVHSTSTGAVYYMRNLTVATVPPSSVDPVSSFLCFHADWASEDNRRGCVTVACFVLSEVVMGCLDCRICSLSSMATRIWLVSAQRVTTGLCHVSFLATFVSS
jgi:hypothetical protein